MSTSSELLVIHARGKAYAVPKAVAEVYNDLIHELISSLPFVENAEDDPCLKPGVAKKRVASIRSALKQAGAI